MRRGLITLRRDTLAQFKVGSRALIRYKKVLSRDFPRVGIGMLTV